MSRRLSCSMTVDAVRDRTKTVTRRHVDTWKNLKVGDRLTLIEKGMGLPKGARQVVLAEVEIVNVHIGLLMDMSDAECVAEGFPSMRALDFIDFWLGSHGLSETPLDELDVLPVRRIEWRYLDGAAQ